MSFGKSIPSALAERTRDSTLLRLTHYLRTLVVTGGYPFSLLHSTSESVEALCRAIISFCLAELKWENRLSLSTWLLDSLEKDIKSSISETRTVLMPSRVDSSAVLQDRLGSKSSGTAQIVLTCLGSEEERTAYGSFTCSPDRLAECVQTLMNLNPNLYLLIKYETCPRATQT